MYSHILVPIDGSGTSERGLEEAIRLAGALRAQLRLLHVIDGFPMLMDMSAVASFDATMQHLRDFGAEVLAKAAKSATAADVETTTVVREITRGRIADIVLDEVRTAKCDLIVMGTHGRRGFSRLALGSDADLVVRESPVPVLLVRHEE
ncbi:MAG: universal stress protein [Gammaproteobacteria bacterium]|nr:universal stress protein [Gammaproteobacteria bacterium]MBU1439863.1 universal stress protein [Gammaproteobacteria bacterium]MBU2286230.1 universal stress protein [Gammaproteobacteria bacterium]MBU2407200.1 universal stress protein [Gammaproteobacteria bacterium]